MPQFLTLTPTVETGECREVLQHGAMAWPYRQKHLLRPLYMKVLLLATTPAR
eukprot:CAMPEP_0179320514 /NCGR_PEP_ID=MMETSP0797-20121207/58091_1 /TAXON_ID=47934 /ORGANISM="Dinophysis acuminata, Strain DAEP01" /LENGTH=51 /DNA_ID=CAMNT_0021032021 /DNA_START=199 /DNA_END=350 /DNA_ORIENTATION=+